MSEQYTGCPALSTEKLQPCGLFSAVDRSKIQTMRTPEELAKWLTDMVPDSQGQPIARMSDMLSRALAWDPNAIADPLKLNRCANEAIEFGILHDADLVLRIDVIWDPEGWPVAFGILAVCGEMLFVGASAHELLARYTGKIATPNDDEMTMTVGALARALTAHILSGKQTPLVMPMVDDKSLNWRSFLPRIRSVEDVQRVLSFDHVNGPPLERYGPTLN